MLVPVLGLGEGLVDDIVEVAGGKSRSACGCAGVAGESAQVVGEDDVSSDVPEEAALVGLREKRSVRENAGKG